MSCRSSRQSHSTRIELLSPADDVIPGCLSQQGQSLISKVVWRVARLPNSSASRDHSKRSARI